MKQEITITLTLDEVNTILSALGDRPYVQVFELVRKVQEQAAEQVRRGEGKNPTE